MLQCTKCKQSKDESEFRERKELKRGYQSWCKECERNNNRSRYVKKGYPGPRIPTKSKEVIAQEARDRILKYRYSMTQQDYIDLYNKQNGKCAICQDDKPLGGKNGLYIDHDHITNKVRGLLCPSCNSAIGKLKERKDILLRAIEYLKLHNNL